MGDDQVDALIYAWREIAKAQGHGVGPLPDSLGYCFWCHELVECYRADWVSGTPGPVCNRPSHRRPAYSCAMPLYPIRDDAEAALVWASYQLGGFQAAHVTWVDRGRPHLGTPYDEVIRGR